MPVCPPRGRRRPSHRKASGLWCCVTDHRLLILVLLKHNVSAYLPDKQSGCERKMTEHQRRDQAAGRLRAVMEATNTKAKTLAEHLECSPPWIAQLLAGTRK